MTTGQVTDDDIEYSQLANPNPGGQQAGCYVPPLVAFQRSTGIAFVVHDPERSQFKMKAKARDGLMALLGRLAELDRMRPVFEAALADDADYGPLNATDRKRSKLCQAIDAAGVR